jgi:hypothetical protein
VRRPSPDKGAGAGRAAADRGERYRDGRAYLLADQVENARACAERAVMLARRRGERGDEAWALRLLGEIASHHARPDVPTATAHYDAAMPLASELEMPLLVAGAVPQLRRDSRLKCEESM